MHVSYDLPTHRVDRGGDSPRAGAVAELAIGVEGVTVAVPGDTPDQQLKAIARFGHSDPRNGDL